jgi:DNA-binding GntR family transcriptional regulator
MPSTTLPRETVASATLKAVRELILHGELKAGEPVRQEWLSDRLGVSRIPVREALRQLEAEGLVTFTPHKGAVVPRLSLEEIGELFELRALIEVDVLRRAVPRLAETDLARARTALQRFGAAFRKGDVSAWGKLNWAFHSALYAPANRPRSLAVLENLNRHADRYARMTLVLTHGREQAEREHEALLAHCTKRDTRGACALLRTHILGAGERLIVYLRAQQEQDGV